jgi:NlpC/P60 family putative phage cell wall peptidase
VSAEEIAAAARAWLGTPYRHQASTLGAGCDCLGLIRGVWRAVVGEERWTVPPYRRDAGGGLAEAAAKWLRRGELGTGAVLLFRLHRGQPPRHCGIMVTGTRFVHAQERLGVVEADLSDAWRRRVAGVFAFPEAR